MGILISLVLVRCSTLPPLRSRALGTMTIDWKFTEVLISVRLTLAPLVAFLIMALLGCSVLCVIVLWTTHSVVWLPMDRLGPTNLVPF